MNNKSILPLSQINKGCKVVIKNIKNTSLENQLGQVGIFVDNEISISKIALFGSPIALQTSDTEIAIRKEVADLIEVQML